MPSYRRISATGVAPALEADFLEDTASVVCIVSCCSTTGTKASFGAGRWRGGVTPAQALLIKQVAGQGGRRVRPAPSAPPRCRAAPHRAWLRLSIMFNFTVRSTWVNLAPPCVGGCPPGRR
jgi:hypothetical protein